MPAKVAHIEYDPNRTARIALLHYIDGTKRYIIAPEGLKQGDIVESGPAAGVLAACYLARQTGEGDLIAFDMGGTTAKAANQKPVLALRYE